MTAAIRRMRDSSTWQQLRRYRFAILLVLAGVVAFDVLGAFQQAKWAMSGYAYMKGLGAVVVGFIAHRQIGHTFTPDFRALRGAASAGNRHKLIAEAVVLAYQLVVAAAVLFFIAHLLGKAIETVV